MDVVFLVYGLAFLAMGLAIVIRFEQDSRLELGRMLWLLAAFGFSHGLLEWTDLWRVVRGDPPWLAALRPILLLVSYLFLLEFGRRLMRATVAPLPTAAARVLLGPWIHALLLSGVALGTMLAETPALALNVWSRYLVGFPGALLAGIGFFRYYGARLVVEMPASEHRRLRRASLLAGGAFVAYGILGGLIVPQAGWFPASVLSQEGFLAAFHIPVQLWRAACAVAAALAVMSLLRVFHLEAIQRLERARRAAEAASAAKSVFLATMSHELRTPMNGVLGMAQLLRDTPLATDQREFVGIINTCGESLMAVINDILDYSKIEAGKVALESVDLSLGGLLGQVEDVMTPKIREKGLGFRCAVGADLPEIVRGDPTRLRQVLLNLAGNAIKFTSAGEVAIEARLEATAANTVTVRFSVIDTGIGIPPEKIPHLFEAFTQADSSTTREFGGTGLGLSISKGLVEQMGGRIGVDSVAGRGSTFWFTAVLCRSGD